MSEFGQQKVSKHQIYYYHLKRLGITEEEIEKEVELIKAKESKRSSSQRKDILAMVELKKQVVAEAPWVYEKEANEEIRQTENT